jgi:hypothetical protein
MDVEVTVACFKVLSLDMPGGTEEKNNASLMTESPGHNF